MKFANKLKVYLDLSKFDRHRSEYYNIKLIMSIQMAIRDLFSFCI